MINDKLMYNQIGGKPMKLDKSLIFSKKIIKIVKVITLINIFVAIAIFFFSINKDFREFAATSSTLTLGIFKIVFKEDLINTGIKDNYLTYACIVISIMCVLWYLILRQIEKIITNALDSSIFCKQNVHSLNLIAFYILLNGIVSLIAQFMQIQMIQRHINMLNLFNYELISNISLDVRFDISFVIVAFLIFVLAKIFAYGEQLQELSDETL